VALGGSEPRIARVLRVLERELPIQILPDGGHRSRSPSVQLAVLRDLVDMRAVLRAARIEVPGSLPQSIERMGPLMVFMRHGDRGTRPPWRRVARASAAHSVLVVGDTNSAEIMIDGAIGRAPGSVRCERAEEGGHQWIAASHDGYRPRFGLSYSRELYLAADGDDLRGEDKLTGRSGASFALRFHLHPAVEAALIEEGGGALLKLPSGVQWRLRAAGAAMSLGESVYLGAGELRKTQQIVMIG